MNQKKVEKPQLQGLRNKTRKRDEKEKYDSVAFRDKIFQLIDQAGSDLEQVSKALETGGASLDYRRYAEPLFDILIAGGLLAPGGLISDEGDSEGPIQTDVCIFKQAGGRDSIAAWYELLYKLIRRYKYLEKGFDDELKKVICYLKGFTADQKRRLAELFVVSFSNGLATPNCLLALFEDYLVKDGLSAEFATELFRIILLEEKDTTLLSTMLKKAGIEHRLMELFPMNKRTPEIFAAYFRDAGLQQIVDYQLAKADAELRKEFFKKVDQLIKDEASAKEISAFLNQHKAKSNIADHDYVVMVWNTLMNAVEWSKKEEIVGEQALKHLKQYGSVLQPWTSSGKAELALLNKVQEYCYDNMNFMKVFQKIIMLFYKMDVISEDTILLWYREAASQKGKSVFIQQMKTFVEWLQKAEEEASEEDEDDGEEKNGQKIESGAPSDDA